LFVCLFVCLFVRFIHSFHHDAPTQTESLVEWKPKPPRCQHDHEHEQQQKQGSDPREEFYAIDRSFRSWEESSQPPHSFFASSCCYFHKAALPSVLPGPCILWHPFFIDQEKQQQQPKRPEQALFFSIGGNINLLGGFFSLFFAAL
jgi:hypothetical protein